MLFRVLFATAAFFAGAGILAYLLAWAAIPEAGTAHAPIDRWAYELRRRRVPMLLVFALAFLALWAVAFSWWAPGPFFPVIAVVLILVAVFARKGWRANADAPKAGGPVTAPATAPVNLAKDTTETPAATASVPGWVSDTRQWIREAGEARRLRRQRALPIKITTTVLLVLTLATLATIDAVHGIRLFTYFWVTAAIIVLSLLVGAVLRRTAWSVAILLVPAFLGMVAFAGSTASLHDGSGTKDWTPTSAPASSYKLAFGQGVLDLRSMPALTAPKTITVTAAAGQIKVLLPSTLNATVDARVRFGDIDVDGTVVAKTRHDGHFRFRGYNIEHTVLPPAGSFGPSLTIDVRLADGNVTVDHS